MTKRTVEIVMRRKRTIYERQTYRAEVTDEGALAVRAYEGPPEDHDYAAAVLDRVGEPMDGWEEESSDSEMLDPGEGIDITPSLTDEPPIIAKS